jgi:hypothetical protein
MSIFSKAQLAKLLGLTPLFEMFVEVIVTEKDGKVTRYKKRCHSYVRAFIDVLALQMTQLGADTLPAIDYLNAPRAIIAYTYNLNILAGAGAVYNGIVVGTSDDPVLITDYALHVPIGNGGEAGQLSYSSVSYTYPVTVGTSRQFTIARTFTNTSGEEITVEEVALYGSAKSGATIYYFCFDRSLLEFPIPNEASSTVTYTIKVTV